MDDNLVGESVNTANLELKESNETDTSVPESDRMDSTLSKEQDEECRKECDAADNGSPCEPHDEKSDVNIQCPDEAKNSGVIIIDDDIMIVHEIKGIEVDNSNRESNENFENRCTDDNAESAAYHMDHNVEIREDKNDYSDYESVLFLSIGNVCRAPMAAAILSNLIIKRDLEEFWAVDSAALAELHIQELIDPRASKCLTSYSVYNCHRCRLVTKRDFQIYRYYFCMDELDLNVIDKWLPPEFDKSRIKLLGDLHPDGPVELEDPYDASPYDEAKFHELYRKILACITMLVDQHSDPAHQSRNRSLNVVPDFRPLSIRMTDSEEEGELEDQEAFAIESEEEFHGGQYVLEDLPEPPEDMVTQEDSKSIDEATDNEEDANKFVVPHVSPAASDNEGER